jgi:hypothetical protein
MMLLYGLFDPGKRGKLAGMFKLGSKVIIKLGWCVVLLRVADLGKVWKTAGERLSTKKCYCGFGSCLSPKLPRSRLVRGVGSYRD